MGVAHRLVSTPCNEVVAVSLVEACQPDSGDTLDIVSHQSPDHVGSRMPLEHRMPTLIDSDPMLFRSGGHS